MAPPTTTRAAILRRAMSLVPDLAFATVDGVTALTATGGSASGGTGGAGTLVDTANGMASGYSTARFANWFMERPTAAAGADKVRVIPGTGYAGATQTVTVNGAYTNAPVNTDPYRITKNHPYQWHTALNEALRTECFFVRNDTWTPVSNTRHLYDVSAAPITIADILRMSDIQTVEYHSITDPTNEENWRPWANGSRTYNVYENNGTIYIDFGLAPPGTVDQMRIVSTHPYSTLTDETTTLQVDPEWAAYATLLCMARTHADLDNPGDLWTEAMHRLKPQEFCRDRRRQELGKYAFRRVEQTALRGGFVSVGGRAGR